MQRSNKSVALGEIKPGKNIVRLVTDTDYAERQYSEDLRHYWIRDKPARIVAILGLPAARNLIQNVKGRGDDERYRAAYRVGRALALLEKRGPLEWFEWAVQQPTTRKQFSKVYRDRFISELG